MTQGGAGSGAEGDATGAPPADHEPGVPPLKGSPLDAPRPRTHRAWHTLSPVWATRGVETLSPTQVKRVRPRDRHTDRTRDAEYRLYHRPSRFRRYLEECLFADERF
jgi:hypothetical protein